MEIFILAISLVIGTAGMFIYIMIKLNELHLSVNSRLDLLLAKTDALARAEGFKAGQAVHNRTDG